MNLPLPAQQHQHRDHPHGQYPPQHSNDKFTGRHSGDDPPTNEPVTVDLRFAFKGERNYVHGTDIYQAIMDALTQEFAQPLQTVCTGLKLSFRKPSQHHCQLWLAPAMAAGTRPDSPSVEIQFLQEAQPFTGCLVETSKPVTERYRYDESGIMASSRVEQNTVTQVCYPGYSMIENLVAMTKRLHLTHFPHAQGNWFFSRLELSQPLPASSGQSTSVTLKQNLGQRLTCSTLVIDGENVGTIYFSLVRAS